MSNAEALSKRVAGYRSLPVEDMIKYKDDFIDQVLMPYWLAVFEDKDLNENLCIHLLTMTMEEDSDIDYALELEKAGQIKWEHRHDKFNPDCVQLCGWIVEHQQRRNHANITTLNWIEDKKKGLLPDGEYQY